MNQEDAKTRHWSRTFTWKMYWFRLNFVPRDPACNRGAGKFQVSCVDRKNLPKESVKKKSTQGRDAGPLAPTKRQFPRHRRLLREHVTVALDVVYGGVGGSAQRFCARLYLASACRIQGSAHGDARSANCIGLGRTFCCQATAVTTLRALNLIVKERVCA